MTYICIMINIKAAAAIVHEANKTYCESIGDNSQPSWIDAPDWQKESAIKGIEFVIKNPNATPEDSHKSWLAVKEADGWKYGEVKDADNKVHPCFVPYNELPKEQQFKDALYTTLVKQLIPLLFSSEYEKAKVGHCVSNGAAIVGITFNPSNDGRVEFLKQMFAEAINLLPKPITDNQKLLYPSIISKLLEAQMFAVKYLFL